jgi:protein-S-isoprenylcysteine O-methyltransferase Ste14
VAKNESSALDLAPAPADPASEDATTPASGRRPKEDDEAPPEARSRDLSRLSRHSYLAGLAGVAAVLVVGYLAARFRVLERGWGLGDGPPSKHLATAFALITIAAVMFVVELGVRLRVDRGRVLSIREDVRRGELGRFLRECLLVWIIELGLLSLALAIYKNTTEYAFQRGGEYYKPWFAIMEIFRSVYLWGGLPYVVLTRALQHDPRADEKQAAFTVMKACRLSIRRVDPTALGADAPRERFDRRDRSAILGLCVKLFFVPLMTVFFADQFTHLVKNYDYVLRTVLSGPRAPMSVRDLHNVAFTVIFSIDVGLAWGGYVVSSRWIKNTLFSVEPTILGWVVALLSYPPYNRVFGFYFTTPSESGFLTMASKPVVAVLAVCSVASFVVYMSATVCFGLRFSNLTHRGVITTGPYAIVRHPAYAAKNFSWWCVMLPYAIYQGFSMRSWSFLNQVAGLVMLSGIYYWRAITEERHLRRDAEYRAYARRVRYRFIPGIL